MVGNIVDYFENFRLTTNIVEVGNIVVYFRSNLFGNDYFLVSFDQDLNNKLVVVDFAGAVVVVVVVAALVDVVVVAVLCLFGILYGNCSCYCYGGCCCCWLVDFAFGIVCVLASILLLVPL